MVSLKHKKAQEMIISNTMLELIVSAIAIILLVFLGCRLLGVDSDADTARKNFDMFAVRIDSLLESEEDFLQANMLFYLPDDYIVVGFDHDWSTTVPQNNYGIHVLDHDNSGPLLKPSDCGEGVEEKACLCLYDGDIHEKDLGGSDQGDPQENLVYCYLYDEKVKFVSNFATTWSAENERLGFARRDVYYDFIEFDELYEYTYFKGNKLRNLYIEKFQTWSDELYILTAFQSDAARNRYYLYHKNCPEGSSMGCYNTEYGQETAVTAECEINAHLSATNAPRICSDVNGDRFCQVVCIEPCPIGPVEIPCDCGGEYVERGTCLEVGGSMTHYDWIMNRCDDIAGQPCWSYCSFQQNPDRAFCDERGAQICNVDFCNLEEDGCGAELVHSTGFYACHSNP